MRNGTQPRGGAQARPLRAIVTGGAAALLMVASLLAGTAAASDGIECGDIITADTTLTHDLGPCPGNGLIVRGDGITLDLGGHRIFADNVPMEQVGIRIGRSHGVAVQNGTVEGFDAGVEIVGGGGNTVQHITAVNNINDMLEPWRFERGEGPMDQPDVKEGNVSAGQWLADMLCFYGDGITVTSSDDNVIRHNVAMNNGPYGGITLVGDSDRNRVENNRAHANNINSYTTRADGSQGSALCGATLPGAPGMQRGREVQAMGIRIEGPGADENVVEGNEVTDSALVGISIHSYVCIAPPGHPGGTEQPNEHNVISKNRVSSTGDERRFIDGEFVSVERDSFADGIGSLSQGPILRVTCTSHNNTIVDNHSSDNDRHGVSVHTTVENTEVSGNVAMRNGGSGIWVAGPRLNPDGTVRTPGASNNTLERNRAFRNTEDDGFDGNVDCDNNAWNANHFGTVNQECVASGGTGWVGGPGQSGGAGQP